MFSSRAKAILPILTFISLLELTHGNQNQAEKPGLFQSQGRKGNLRQLSKSKFSDFRKQYRLNCPLIKGTKNVSVCFEVAITKRTRTERR
jgi:hypothetical protein